MSFVCFAFLQLITSLEPKQHGESLLNFALIASTRQHPFWDAFLSAYVENPNLLAPTIANNALTSVPPESITVLPSEYFAPLSAQETRELFQTYSSLDELQLAIAERVPITTIAVHMWGWSYGTQSAYYHTRGGMVDIRDVVPSLELGSNIVYTDAQRLPSAIQNSDT